jgi:hypothetical protein
MAHKAGGGGGLQFFRILHGLCQMLDEVARLEVAFSNGNDKRNLHHAQYVP